MSYTYTESVVQGSTYRESVPRKPGYTAYVRGSVDTAVLGDYEVTYTYIKKDPFHTIVETKLVSVVYASGGGSDVTDASTPQVILNGDSVYTIDVGDSWEDPGATATVETSPGVIEDVPVLKFSSVDNWPNAEAGTYQIVYYAVSPANKIGFAMRTVKVGITYRDITGDTVAPGFTLNGCEKLFVEYPTGTTKPIYVGADYTGVGSHIIKDEGFTLDDPDDPTFTRMSIIVEDTSNQVCTLQYADKESCEQAGGTWGYVSTFPQTDEVYMQASDTETRTYNIKYTVNDLHGNTRTRVRTVVMLAEGEQADELQDQIAYGCISNDDKDDIGDVIQDEDPTKDPHANTNEPTIPNEDISQDTLNIMCAGDTAYFGGVALTTRLPHPNEIPETIIETRYVPDTDVQGLALLFTNTYEIYMPDGSVKGVRSEGVAIWRLHKIHNRNLVTYSLGPGGLARTTTNDVIFSSFHLNSDGVDVFYGRWGTHIFSDPPGWGNAVSQKTYSWASGRVLPSPASFTEVTAARNTAWITRAQASNVSNQYVFNDPNRLVLNNGGWVNSLPMFRGIDNAVRDGGPSNAGDILSLHWHNFGGGRNVANYCNFVWTPPPPPPPPPKPTLNLYCNFSIEPNPGASSPPSGYVIPYQFFEASWTQHSCYGAPTCHPTFVNERIDDVELLTGWTLKAVADDEAVYMNGSGTVRSITNSGNSVTFTGLHATYTFSSWEYGNAIGGASNEWMTNFSSRNTFESGYISIMVHTMTSTQGFYNPWTGDGGTGVTGAGTINSC